MRWAPSTIVIRITCTPHLLAHSAVPPISSFLLASRRCCVLAFNCKLPSSSWMTTAFNMLKAVSWEAVASDVLVVLRDDGGIDVGQ
ncbi:hypothetical protein CPC08DRAFT_147832 [Agrocybe pediades]|nr:hypothetical protein CPC08DRAFT_147832 [Agrocybe pediades]